MIQFLINGVFNLQRFSTFKTNSHCNGGSFHNQKKLVFDVLTEPGGYFASQHSVMMLRLLTVPAKSIVFAAGCHSPTSGHIKG